MRNCPEYLVAFYGIWSMGAVILPINSKLHIKEVADFGKRWMFLRFM